MKLQELMEGVRRAVGSDVERAQRMSQRDQRDPEYSLLWVNIKDLLSHTNPGQQIDLETGEGQISHRIPRAKAHWSQGGFMDPALVAFNDYTNDFAFTDGRHRLVSAYQMGETFAPVLFPTSQVDIVKKRLQTK